MLCVCVCPRACADVWCNMRVHFLAVFRPEKPIAVKLQFIFNLFDYNMDDTLDPEELNEMLAVVSDVKRPHAHTHTHTHTHRHAHAQACTLALLLSRVVPRSRACSTPACVLSCEGNGPSAVLMHGTSGCRSLEVLLQRAESVSVTENRSRPPTHPPTLSLPPSLPPSLPLTLSNTYTHPHRVISLSPSLPLTHSFKHIHTHAPRHLCALYLFHWQS